MNLLRGSMLALLMCLVGYTGFGQVKKDTVAVKSDTLKLSVAQAQQYALENNRSILNANLDIESAKKKVWETIAKTGFAVTRKVRECRILSLPRLSLHRYGIRQRYKVRQKPSPESLLGSPS